MREFLPLSDFALLIVLFAVLAIAAAAATLIRRRSGARAARPFAWGATVAGIIVVLLLWAESELTRGWGSGIPFGLLLLLHLAAFGTALIGIEAVIRARPPRGSAPEPEARELPTSGPTRSARLPLDRGSMLREELSLPLRVAGAFAVLVLLLAPISYAREGPYLKGIGTMIFCATLLGVGDVIIIFWASARAWRATDRRQADPALRAPLTLLLMAASCTVMAVLVLLLVLLFIGVAH